MVDVNVPNFITIGLIAVVFFVVIKLGLKAIGQDGLASMF